MNKSNIFTKIPEKLKDELFEDIISQPNVKIQRIVSQGHTTQEFEWYDQDSNEWVMLLQGKAIVSFKDEENITLSTGDYINISAHKKHKVSYTSQKENTIWLAVHY